MAVTYQHVDGPTNDPPLPAPPTGPTGAPIQPTPPVWPTLIGVVCIIVGAGGLLTYGIGLISNLFMALMSDTIEQSNVDPVNSIQFSTASEYLWWNLLSAGAGLALASLLLWGGISLVRRRPSSANILTTWAVARMVWSVPALIMTFVVMNQQFTGMSDAMQQSGSTPPRAVTAIFDLMPAVTIVLAALWAWALPVFVLIWFRRRSIRSQLKNW